MSEIILNPWVVMALVCGTIAYGIYIVLFGKQKSEFREEETIARDKRANVESVGESLKLVLEQLSQMNKRLESLENAIGQQSPLSKASPNQSGVKVILYDSGIGQRM